MTEKERAMNGLLYFAGDSELVEGSAKASDMCHEYNMTQPSKKVERDEIIRKLLGKTDKCFTIRSPFFCDYGYNIEIGDNFFSNANLVILDCAKVVIGDNVLIGPNVGIYAAGHPVDPQQRLEELEFALPITIGNNVWIGAHAAILPGVEIGENSVIGAGSVVSKNIPANVIAVGNPCKVVRSISKKDKEKYRRE